MIRGEAVGDFVFVGVTTFQESHGANGAEEPCQLMDFGDRGLTEEGGFRRVKPAGEEGDGEVMGVLAEERGVFYGCHRVIIGDKVEGFSLFLQSDGRFHGSEVIANVEFPAGL